ncbi:hypothetical protein GCM10010399_47620 [Dactylosporangium fulvum]
MRAVRRTRSASGRFTARLQPARNTDRRHRRTVPGLSIDAYVAEITSFTPLVGSMVMCDRDRTGSIKLASPAAAEGQTRNDLASQGAPRVIRALAAYPPSLSGIVPNIGHFR